jgi:hypothetical protein
MTPPPDANPAARETEPSGSAPDPGLPLDVPSDRRAASRFQPAFGTVFRFLKGEADEPAVGLVWNLSRTGVSMLLPDPPQRGTLLPGELFAETTGMILPITLRIVHARPLSTGDFLLGAQFSEPLEDENLQLFLAPPLPELQRPPRG